ncbi:hypothetical protein C8Q73DRAFT_153680 [Cubamyces lactineus]|nr:hypothetical protein C8Q73DRAFT_153680 [Cubamyces lactineus]
MVRSFNDPEALIQAQAMRPKLYLVYLRQNHNIGHMQYLVPQSRLADGHFPGAGTPFPRPAMVQIRRTTYRETSSARRQGSVHRL